MRQIEIVFQLRAARLIRFNGVHVPPNRVVFHPMQV
jgi:hypothetical protein